MHCFNKEDFPYALFGQLYAASLSTHCWLSY